MRCFGGNVPHVQLAYKEHERTSEKSSGAVARGAMHCTGAASNPLGCLGEGSQKSLLAVGFVVTCSGKEVFLERRDFVNEALVTANQEP